METFSSLLEELHGLNTKTHQQLLSDLKASGAIHPWYGDWYRMLVSSIETTILEKELLK